MYSQTLREPSSNFGAVRDGRNSQVYYQDIDLSVARDGSAANPALIIAAAGNSFYIDANPADGVATVVFQNRGASGSQEVPFYVSPGFIVSLPFTQLLVLNAAQTGKKLRIVYGIDVDFQPGSVAQVAIAVGGWSTYQRDNALLGKIFRQYSRQVVPLTSNITYGIRNPAGSGKTVELLSWKWTNYGPGVSANYIIGYNLNDAVGLTNVPFNDANGSATASSLISTYAAFVATPTFAINSSVQGDTKDLMENRAPIILPAGKVLMVNAINGMGNAVTFEQSIEIIER